MNRLFVLLLLAAIALAVIAIRRRIRTEWTGTDLTSWHPAHRDPAGDVWAITPPCGYGHWALFAPGAPVDGPFPYAGVTPAAVHPTAGFGEDHDRLRLVDVEHWMRPWVEQASGGRVAEIAEGLSAPYGPHGYQQEYVIYARVVTS